MSKQDRFQYQPWYIKLWRYRWYLLIPLDIFKMWLYNKTSKDFIPPNPYSLQNYCDIAIGSAQIKMKWVYDFEDLTFRRPKNKKE
jgi:hypothetical protein